LSKTMRQRSSTLQPQRALDRRHQRMAFIMRIISNLSTLSLSLVVALLSAGCAPKNGKMIANNVPKASIVHGAVIVFVSGGNHPTLLDSTLVSDESFSAALVQSLRKTGLFRSVQTSGTASYKLDAILMQVTDHSSAMFGLKVDWRLTQPPDHVVWSGQTKFFFSGPLRPTYVDVEHLRMVTEEAARENIEQALAELVLVNF
jgi:hypothetical protein